MGFTRLETSLNSSLKNSFNNLYALCDYSTLEQRAITLEQFVKICKNKQATILQYRDKLNPLPIQIRNLKYLKQHIDIPIIINDKLDLVSYVHGIHLGQEDLQKIHKNKDISIKLIRKEIKDKLLGISTHNEKEILELNGLDIDMIGLGAYKKTKTKKVSNILGNKISYLAKISKHFVCAIGCVKPNDKIKNVHFNVVGSGLYD